MAAGGSKNFYEVLGVPQTASLDEIKKRYRELARQYHPDVNPNDPNASRKFAEVAEAYSVLSDADRRGVHDYELKNARERAEAARRRTTTPSSSSQPSPSAARAASAQSAGTTPPNTATAGSESARLVAQAQAALIRNRLVEARTLAEQSLRLNRRNAQAYEVLGDVFRIQNKVDEAMNMYSMALQINPRNPSVMQRLERMSRASSSRSGPSGSSYRPSPPPPRSTYTPPPSSPAGTRPSASNTYRPANAAGASSYTPRPAPPSPLYTEPEKRPLAQLLWGVLGYGLTVVLLLWFTFNHGEAPLQTGVPIAPILEPVSTWNTPLKVVMVLSGILLGWTMTGTLAIRRIEDELLLSGTTSGGGRFLPVGAVLIVLSFINFYAAAMLYLILQFFQEAVTQTMLRVFGAVVGVVLLLTAVYSPGHGQVFLFGGNVVFLSFLVGWFLGDFFRPDGF